ncbi:MAG TPA: hypothetical protein VET65_08600 [Candidatus Limnocylindrales bacterium]|nr:hypothetical protein [Candidatus Limnocylindrales bacterium]
MGRRSVLAFAALLAAAVVLQLTLSPSHLTPFHSPSPSPSASARPSGSATPSGRPTSTPTARPTPTPTARPTTPVPTYVPTPAPPTVSVAGSGGGQSRTFALNDSLGYLARYSLYGACQYFGSLNAVDGSYTNTDFITDAGPTSGTKIMDTLFPGTYYISMNVGAGCGWSVTFSPR